MDFTTIIGIVGGFGVIIAGILNGGELGNFIDTGSILITIGGTICAVIASFPANLLKNIPKHMKKLIKADKYNVEELIDTMVEFSQTARANGLLALEEKANALEDPFMKKGVLFVVDAMETEKIRESLEEELDTMITRHESEIEIYERAASYAPSFGMIGTLVGLINMLKNLNLSDGASDAISTNMSIALVTTLYGCMLANLLFNPMANKLRIRNNEEIFYKQMIIAGVLGIQAGDNPKMLREKLASLVQQKKQQGIISGETQSGEGKGKGKQKEAKAPKEKKKGKK